MKTLDQIASESRTVKLWVENLVKPVLLMMTYVMAEREGDWLLHLATFKMISLAGAFLAITISLIVFELLLVYIWRLISIIHTTQQSKFSGYIVKGLV